MRNKPTSRRFKKHQINAISKLRTGSILLGGVGSGKSFTSLGYFFKECGGSIADNGTIEFTKKYKQIPLYIITTAKKRNSLDWIEEAKHFDIVIEEVDSWNNVSKYTKVKDAFFIFDEQKVVGSGTWAKSFVKIAKKNKWILLTATPGDTWLDYVAVFVANGFYKNRTAFMREHAVYNPYTSFPLLDRFVNQGKLARLKESLLVRMPYERKTIPHHIDIIVDYDEILLEKVLKDKWNVFENKPIKNSAEAAYIMRKVVNKNVERLDMIERLTDKHQRLIVFYNFDYELELLKTLEDRVEYQIAEYNGHLHEDIPQGEKWIYLVQYLAGAEAWECTTTNAIVFFSLNYSYKLTHQAGGRIDRMNTPFLNLYYYYIRTNSLIDKSIVKALKSKTEFNEEEFIRSQNILF